MAPKGSLLYGRDGFGLVLTVGDDLGLKDVWQEFAGLDQ